MTFVNQRPKALNRFRVAFTMALPSGRELGTMKDRRGELMNDEEVGKPEQKRS